MPRVNRFEDRNGECAFRVTDHGRQTTVEIEVSGELDLASAPEFGRLIRAHGTHDQVIVVLAECSFADSTALNELAKAHSNSSNGGPALLLRSPQAPVRRVLEVCGLDQVLTIDNGSYASSRAGDAA